MATTHIGPRPERVRFCSGDLELEGELHAPTTARQAAVVCHPHPQYGGDMHNSVVRAVGSALVAGGCTVLRFNFRGVGASEGAYGGGIAETDDALAAVQYVRGRKKVSRVALVGYSFGALVALRAAARSEMVCCVAAVAPPFTMMPPQDGEMVAVPTLFVVGDRDLYAGVDAIDRFRAASPVPTQHAVLDGADHFLFGHEASAGERVAAFVGATCSA